jgi:hypothetical protein
MTASSAGRWCSRSSWRSSRTRRRAAGCLANAQRGASVPSARAQRAPSPIGPARPPASLPVPQPSCVGVVASCPAVPSSSATRNDSFESIRNLTPAALALAGDRFSLRERQVVHVDPRLDLCSIGGGVIEHDEDLALVNAELLRSDPPAGCVRVVPVRWCADGGFCSLVRVAAGRRPGCWSYRYSVDGRPSRVDQ